ncbi:MAG: ribokinase [Lachnospiraceae bacterium]|nr:ribokinase [Lachnospiraceae bacterium]
MRVLCFGSLNLDYVYPVDHIVRLGETESSSGVNVNCGGKGLNQSVALARAGVPVWHAGLVGSEGQPLIDKCVQNGVNAEHVHMIEGRSGHTIIQVDKEGNNSILLFGGANMCITEEFIDEVISDFEKDDIILLQNEINLLDIIIEKAYEKGMKIVLNPSPFNESLEKCNLNKISYFILNEIEGEQMTGIKEPEGILEEMRKRYPLAKVVLTLGEEGSLYQCGKDIYRQSAYKVKAVDTTAAGDTFTGYFISAVIKGMKPEEGLDLAAKASAIAVTRQGALDSVPTIDEVSRGQTPEGV